MDQIDILLLVCAVGGLIYMLGFIRKVRRGDQSRPLPPDLIRDKTDVDDPFRSREAMDRRMEDFGRFNIRYNEADGVMPWRELMKRLFR